MDDSEVFVFLFALGASLGGAVMLSASRLHPLRTRANPGIGLHRLAVLLAMLWTAWVLRYHADPSVTGFYVLFYALLTYGLIKAFGQGLGPMLLGFNVRREVFVGGNRPVGVLTAALALATGLLAGGSVWGDADPTGDDEGGWWIPAGFFLLGWGVLMLALWCYIRREDRLVHRLRREHELRPAVNAAVFVLSSASLVLQGVTGDFWGWSEGLLGMGTIALMLLGHEWIARHHADTGESARRSAAASLMEQALYVGLALACWGLSSWISARYTQPLAGA